MHSLAPPTHQSKAASFSKMSRTGGYSTVVDKLAMLRAFVPSNVEESTLSACLSACGFNVERAAEQLMTGQFTSANCASSSKTKKKSTMTTPSVTNHNKRRKLGVKPMPSSAGFTQYVAAQDTSQPIDTNFLLCQRWISDGISRTKHSRVTYNESINVIFGGPIIRFKGAHVEGSLPTNLCAILAPLQGFINMTATALMEDRNIGIGKAVPLSLRIYLADPNVFFALFQERAASNTSSATAAYFGSLQKKIHVRKSRTLELTDAAFALLQWAEYGDVPEFKVPENFSVDPSSDEDEPLCTEDAFQANVTEELTSIAKNLLAQDGTKLLVEAPDPKGLKGITLRSYQRQALSWMSQREKEPSSRYHVQNELELLSELNKSKKKQRNFNVETEVSCEDSGPIRVSELGARKSKTLNGDINTVNHPLWERRYLAIGDSAAVCFYVNEFVGIASAVPPAPPRQCAGGMLCDAMGLGKTIQIAALILASKEEDDDEGEVCVVNPHTSILPLKTTLVVAPMSLLYQWEDEIKTKTSLTHRVYYKENGNGLIDATSFPTVDVVITTYGTLQGELHATKKKQGVNSGLLSYDWYRVVLDEAQNIKNPTTLVAKACYLLKAKCRWAVTGTPISNSLQDVFSLLKFLRHEPWCDASFWRASITSAMANANDELEGNTQNPGGIKVAFDRIRRLLDPLLLRRTKESQNEDGSPIITLPPVETTIVSVQLTPAEREFYSALKAMSQNIFEGLIESGAANKSWFAIFSLLQRLRQASCHIALTAKNFVNVDDWNPDMKRLQEAKRAPSPVKTIATDINTINEEFMERLLTKFRNKSSGKENDMKYATSLAEKLSEAINSNASELTEECPICLERPEIHVAVCTPCAHVFCRECLIDFLNKNGPMSNSRLENCSDGSCPTCNEAIDVKDIIALYKNADGKTDTHYLFVESSDSKSTRVIPQSQVDASNNETSAVARQTLDNALRGADSAKLAAILRELKLVWNQDPGCKVLIFSQFLGFLDLIGTSLTQEGIHHGRLDGSLTAKERMHAIEKFKKVSSRDSKTGSVMLLSMKAGGVGLNLVAASTVFIADPWWNQAVEDQCIDRVHRIGQTADIVRVRKFIVENTVEERIVELQGRKKVMARRVLSDGDDMMGDAERENPSLDDFKLLFGN